MKLRCLVLGLLVVSACWGQWLGTTIYLPDSAGGVLGPRTIACDASGTKVYVGGRTAGVAVLDADSGRRLYRIPTGADVSAICHNPVMNKVYVASRQSDTVTVADGTSGRVLGSVRVGRGPVAMACHSTGDRLYVACAGPHGQPDSVVYEIDCSTDTILAVHQVGANPVALLYNRVTDMVYCANAGSNTVSAISCSGAEPVVHIPVGPRPAALACNPQDNFVYCANSEGITVTVIDGSRNVVETEVPTGTYPVDLCYDSLANTVFCANRGSGNVAVIDGELNRVVATLVVGRGPSDLEFNPDANRVYCLSQYDKCVHVLDASANRVVDSFPISRGTIALRYSRAYGRLHCPDEDEAVVTVIDCGDHSEKAKTRVGIEPEALAANPAGSKVYCFGGAPPWDSVNLSVIDAEQNAVVRTLEVLMRGRPEKTCYNTAEDKLYYLGSGHKAAVIDALADSVLAYVPVPDNAYGLTYVEQENKVYVGGGYFDGYVAAIDGQGDTLVAEVAIPGGGGVYAICGNSGHNTVYGFGNQRGVFTVIDCATDTVVGQFTTGEENPGAALYNPLSDKVYMVTYVSGQMLVIDGATNAVRARLGIGNGARDVCLNTRENKVYSTARTARRLVVVCGEADSLLACLEFPGYTGGVEYDPDYNVAYCTYTADDCGYVVLVDGETERIVGQIPIGRWPGAMLANPALDRVYVAEPHSSCIRVIRTGAGGAAEVKPGPERGRVRASFVCGMLALQPGEDAILLDITGRKVMALVPGENDVSRVAPGVYFVVAEQDRAVSKVILQR
jgi:YVTN family beta-propeller protein